MIRHSWDWNSSSTTITTPRLSSHGWWKCWLRVPTSHTKNECVQTDSAISYLLIGQDRYSKLKISLMQMQIPTTSSRFCLFWLHQSILHPRFAHSQYLDHFCTNIFFDQNASSAPLTLTQIIVAILSTLLRRWAFRRNNPSKPINPQAKVHHNNLPECNVVLVADSVAVGMSIGATKAAQSANRCVRP